MKLVNIMTKLVKKYKKIFCFISCIFIITLFVLSLPVSAVSVNATIILYDIDWNEVATFHTIVDENDEVPWWVQYEGDAYAYEYGSGNTYGYIADGDDFSGYWYENQYIGDINDLPYPPGYQPPEPDPDLIQIRIEAFRINSNNETLTMYTTNIYGEPNEPYTFIPFYQQGFVPEYNSYTGIFIDDTTLYVEYFPLTVAGTSKQITINYLVFDNNVYRTIYTANINIDRTYAEFDTRSVFSNSNYFNSSPYIKLDFDATNVQYYVYLVNINDSSQYLQPYIQAKYDQIYETGNNYGYQIGLDEGLASDNPTSISNFIPRLFGSVVSSGYFILRNIEVDGITLASIFGTIIIIAVIVVILKVIL